MRKWMVVSTLIAAAALMPALAVSQTENGSQAKPSSGVSSAGAVQKGPAASTVPVEDQATKEQLARLFEVMRIREQMASLTKMMLAMIQRQIEAESKEMKAKLPGGSANAEQQAKVEDLMNKYMAKAANIYPVEEMLSDMTAVYQRHMSRSDVEAFIAFYSSTPGQHLLDEQPAIMKEYMPVAMERAQAHTKELTDELAKDMEAIKASTPAPDKTDKTDKQ